MRSLLYFGSRKFLFFTFILVAPFSVIAQTDNVGSGRAILFDGVDDYIDLGNIYDDVALPLTISAWVYVEPHSNVTQYPIFTSQDNTNTYNGFTFVTSTMPHIGFTIGDGRGENSGVFRRSRAGYYESMGEWVYLTAVARSGNDMHTYLNGFDVSAEYQGSSSYPMNSFSPMEVAKIGYFLGNSISYWFKGVIDEVRIWNRALSIEDIRESMCRRLKSTEPNLIGYWNFDEVSGDEVKDLSPNGFHGTLKGNPTRVFSGAPVGDESAFLYTSTWAGKSLSKENLSATAISGNPYGAHIYTVNTVPSQTGGLNAADVKLPYYGVFMADDGVNTSFDLAFLQDNVCGSFQRLDNSAANWQASGVLTGIQNRIEIMPTFETSDLNIDLGGDQTVCDLSTLQMVAGEVQPGRTFTWNTGLNGPVISITTSGEYSVEVREGCQTDRDTIHVTFLTRPPDFSLGEDEVLCAVEPRTLNPSIETNDFDFTWQDGSNGPSFTVDGFGTYWLKIENACGVSIDSITFKQQVYTDVELYNFISPDNTDDRNQYFTLDAKLFGYQLAVFNRWGKQVYASTNYQNDWDGQGLPAGVYFYTINGECIDPLKGTLTIMR